MKEIKELNIKNRRLKKNSGITLIALIITIIVMLILVAVTISMAVNGGLFGQAGKAVGDTQNALNAEQAIANGGIEIDGVWYNSIDDYLKNIPSDKNYDVVSEEITGSDGNFKYVKLQNGNIQITRYIGDGEVVTIPATYDGYEVYAVGNIESSKTLGERYNIFGETNSEKNETITSITFEEGIKKIGTAAFNGCSGLVCDLELPSTLVEIEDCAFNLCSNLTGNLEIPEGVTRIGYAAFQASYGYNGATTNTLLTLPSTLTKIDDYAFNRCKGLIGDLIIPEGVTEIGRIAFADCSGLTGNLNIPEGVTSIGYAAFRNCSSLSGTLTLPSTLAEIGEFAFSTCTGLTGDLIIPEGVTSIGYAAFSNCSSLSGTLTLPSTLTEIGEFAFNYSALTGDLTIPEGVTKIGKYAFQYARGFNGILTLPSTLEEIGDGAFNHCAYLTNTSVTIPKSVKIIGLNETDATHVFYDFANATIQEFIVEEGNTEFKEVDGVLYNAEGTRLVAYPSSKPGSTYEIPEGVTIIDELAFSHANKLKKIILPNTYILTTTLPENYLNVGNNLALGIYCNTTISEVEVKEDNPNYKSEEGVVYSKDGTVLWYVPEARTGEIIIPEGVITIKDGAFYGYSGEAARNQTVTIPVSVTQIEEHALLELKYMGSSKVTFAEGSIYEFKSDGTVGKKS